MDKYLSSSLKYNVCMFSFEQNIYALENSIVSFRKYQMILSIIMKTILNTLRL